MSLRTQLTRSFRTRFGLVATLIALSATLPPLFAGASDPLVPGEDRIGIPAIGQGLCLHNLFQSNMVLQRDKPIRIWGWAAPGETVTVSFAPQPGSEQAGQAQSAAAGADRAWVVTFPAMPANAAPARMLIKGKDKTLTLDNILIGDIWVLGGQSNMEFPLERVEDGGMEISSANFRNIRLLTIPQQNGPDLKRSFPSMSQWSDWDSCHFRKGYWDPCSPETVREMSGIGYIFARRIHLVTQIPIGVIDTSRGGTSVETWTPMARLQKIGTPEVNAMLADWQKKVEAYDPQKDLAAQVDDYTRRVARMKAQGQAIPSNWKVPATPRPSPAMDMNHPGNCYASMLAPIAGLAVKGAIWHQGYNNAMQPNGHVMYYQVFPKMIAAWRTVFNDPKMPFGIISLPTDGAFQTLDNYLEMMVDEGIYIREVQYKTFLDLSKAGDKNIGYASSYDMRRAWYHPQVKIPAGERIARWALATQYGQAFSWKPPVVTAIKTAADKLLLTFNAAVSGPRGCPIEGFAIAGEDRRFQPATVEYLVTGKDSQNQPKNDLKVLVLSSPHVPAPTQYRYAWGRNPMGNLKPLDDPGLTSQPLATQRSDDWPMNEVPVKFGARVDELAMQQARIANRMFDMHRRLNDARRLLDEQKEKTDKELDVWKTKWQP